MDRAKSFIEIARDSVDKTKLKEALDKAKSLNSDDYIENSWMSVSHDLYLDIIPGAEAVYNNENATEEEVNAQITSLINTMARLKTVVDDNLEKAKTAVDNKTKEQDYVVDYTEETRKVLEATLNMPETNDEEKKAKTTAINNALTNLKTVLPQLSGGLKFTDVKGETNNGKTMINLGDVSAEGNTFVYKISDDGNPVRRPSLGTDLSSWTTITNGTIMDIENGRHIGVAEINAEGIVVQFSDAQAETLDYRMASPACAVSMIKQNMATDFTGETVKLVIEVDGNGPENIFYFDLSNTPANKYVNVEELAKAIETGATNEAGKSIAEVVKMNGSTSYTTFISIISKNETDSSSIKVRYEGSTEAVSKAISLIGYYNGVTAEGSGERN